MAFAEPELFMTTLDTAQATRANAASSSHVAGGKWPRLAERCFKCAVAFFLVGLVIGLQMSITHRYDARPAHAHFNLLGWVTMAIFGAYYALQPAKAATKLATIQFYVYTLGCLVLLPSLYLLVTGNPAIEPLVATGAMISFLGVVLFAVVVFRKAY